MQDSHWLSAQKHPLKEHLKHYSSLFNKRTLTQQKHGRNGTCISLYANSWWGAYMTSFALRWSWNLTFVKTKRNKNSLYRKTVLWSRTVTETIIWTACTVHMVCLRRCFDVWNIRINSVVYLLKKFTHTRNAAGDRKGPVLFIFHANYWSGAYMTGLAMTSRLGFDHNRVQAKQPFYGAEPKQMNLSEHQAKIKLIVSAEATEASIKVTFQSIQVSVFEKEGTHTRNTWNTRNTPGGQSGPVIMNQANLWCAAFIKTKCMQISLNKETSLWSRTETDDVFLTQGKTVMGSHAHGMQTQPGFMAEASLASRHSDTLALECEVLARFVSPDKQLRRLLWVECDVCGLSPWVGI